jgi:homoserine acetyltransferase
MTVAIDNPFYSHEHHGEYDMVSIGRLDLEKGGTIPDCQLAVTTWGELNEAIWSDPGWNGGEYASNEEVAGGLKRHAHIWGIMEFSTEFWKQEVWRALEFDSQEHFLEDFLEPYFTVMDPNDLLCMGWKWQRGAVARHTGGDLFATEV